MSKHFAMLALLIEAAACLSEPEADECHVKSLRRSYTDELSNPVQDRAMSAA